MARILTLNRCIDPAPVQKPPMVSRYRLALLLAIPPNLVNPSRIFRELAAIEHHQAALCQHLFHAWHTSGPRRCTPCSTDLSSTTFSGARCMLMSGGTARKATTIMWCLALVVSGEGSRLLEVLPGGRLTSRPSPGCWSAPGTVSDIRATRFSTAGWSRRRIWRGWSGRDQVHLRPGQKPSGRRERYRFQRSFPISSPRGFINRRRISLASRP